MANTTGPQYSRGDQGQPTGSNRYPTASPLAASTDPAGYQQTGDPYANQPYPTQTGYQDQPYQDQRSRGYTNERDTGPQRSREGEAYGYDYRYANGDLGDDRPGANATGWVALVLTVIALALTWDKFGAFIALPVFFLSFLFAQIALSKSGQRKWHAWLAVWLSVIGGFVALISVTVSLIGLMGGLDYSGGKSLLGIVDIPPVQIDRISDVDVSFPRSGLDSLTID
jgi:hypothetical protein